MQTIREKHGGSEDALVCSPSKNPDLDEDGDLATTPLNDGVRQGLVTMAPSCSFGLSMRTKIS